MTRRIYVDHNATTPLRQEVLEAMLPLLAEGFGNPSSIHHEGREARKRLEAAREEVASFCGCDPGEVVFTSGGTEADNLALKGVAAAAGFRGHIVTTAVEHPAVLNCCTWLESLGMEVTRVAVDGCGAIDLEEVRQAIRPDTILVSAMFANNETGVIFPVAEIGAIAAERKIPFHCDAVQGAGRLPIDCRSMNVRLLSLSAHKINGPKGVGALVVKKGTKLHPLLHGGAQERTRRSGTENMAGIAGFGVACRLAGQEREQEAARLSALRDRLIAGIEAAIPGVRLNGERGRLLPNTANISFAGAQADSLLLALDLAGIAASSGAACSSGTLRHSPVLSAMGIDPATAGGSIRFSLGRGNTIEDIEHLLTLLPDLVERVRSAGRKDQ